MKCGIITTIAPSDVTSYELCSAFIKIAIATSLGPFSSVEEIPIFASEEKRENASCKSLGVEKAIASGCEWIFFIDATEFMSLDSFRNVVELVQEYDAIWGLACEAADADLKDAKITAGQLRNICSINDILNNHFDLGTESGFFMRSQVALDLLQARPVKNEVGIDQSESWLHTIRCIKGKFILSIKIKKSKIAEQEGLRLTPLQGEPGQNTITSTCKIACLDVGSDLVRSKVEPVLFSIGTLVTDQTQYGEMLKSFEANGFSNKECEFIFIDNSESNKFDAFDGLNKIINYAKGKYVILCHQDIRLHDDGFDTLVKRLSELDDFDPSWALAGNAGGSSEGFKTIRITDPHGVWRKGNFPGRVFSLDENFIIIRNESRVSFSHDLKGFHFYGTDICMNADMLGYASYVIDFHLLHLSGGNINNAFFEAKRLFEAKWSRALRSRTIQTTCTIVDLEPVPDVEDNYGLNFLHPAHRGQIFQIFYDNKSRDLVSPCFIKFDNTENLRPDWREFWVIRKILAQVHMDEDVFYGFLSPNFSLKTGYAPADVLNTVQSVAQCVEIILLTSKAEDLARYPNPFVQGEFYHPGLLDVCERFLKLIGEDIDLKTVITSLDNSVNSNYIIAKPRFWRKWSIVADQLFNFAENPESELFHALNATTSYKDEFKIQMKVFVQERIATMLLAKSDYNIFVPGYFKKFKMYDNEKRAILVFLDNLKNAYRKTGDIRFLSEYQSVLETGVINVCESIHNLSHITAQTINSEI